MKDFISNYIPFKYRNYNILLALVLIFLFSIYLYSLFNRFSNGDEGILAEQAYWLSKIGYVKSELFTNLGYGWEFIQYHYHKLFIWLAALIINIFGLNLYLLRLFILVFAIIIIYFLQKIGKENHNFDINDRIFLIILLLSQYHFFNFSFIFRPEIPVAATGLLSYYFLYNFQLKNNMNYLILSAFFAGCSALLHLNGLIFIFSGFTYLLFNKQKKGSFIFIAISSFITLFYFLNITSIEDFNKFIYQFTNDPNLSDEDFSFFQKFIQLLKEHQRFFHSPKEIVLSILFFFLLIVNYKKSLIENKSLLQYTLILLLFTSVIVHNKTDKYIVLYLPFLILNIVYFLKQNNEHKFINNLKVLLLSMYFVINWIFNLNIILKDDNLLENNSYYHTKLVKKGVVVFARENLVFNEIKNFKIVTILSFELAWKRVGNGVFNETDFFEFANSIDAYYIILENNSRNQNILSLLKYDDLKLNDKIFNFKIYDKTKNHLILLRQ